MFANKQMLICHEFEAADLLFTISCKLHCPTNAIFEQYFSYDHILNCLVTDNGVHNDCTIPFRALILPSSRVAHGIFCTYYSTISANHSFQCILNMTASTLVWYLQTALVETVSFTPLSWWRCPLFFSFFVF